MADVHLTREPEKYLKSIPEQLKNKFVIEMLALEHDPEAGILLRGSFKGYYRIKFKFQKVDYRIIYRIAWDEDIVYVVLLGPRENIYRRLTRLLRGK
ncbi:type II toxin-antitoxin system RelE/ParE family toxin [Pelotomaculum isophthalicicum JI]|uniref:Type II toxin-antitoxin system RelE/ParE family toxin n=1 Tax=Pelotomaculum isophthalicicum JI TaxID=947010 RepID=A0A9X4H0G9_9FIRM|nr:type II toxin-antitoxin system RelE/ParE family toxin [Pelotomaculum isophthalicicum]MDF9407215.1 type II toxin-antitoxin system RelE/ParE family toxin [Pelotomaculum isophthalicicum JI]